MSYVANFYAIPIGRDFPDLALIYASLADSGRDQ